MAYSKLMLIIEKTYYEPIPEVESDGEEEELLSMTSTAPANTVDDLAGAPKGSLKPRVFPVMDESGRVNWESSRVDWILWDAADVKTINTDLVDSVHPLDVVHLCIFAFKIPQEFVADQPPDVEPMLLPNSTYRRPCRPWHKCSDFEKV